MNLQNPYAPEVYAWDAYPVKRNLLTSRKAIGKRLKKRREESGLTQAAVAGRLDVSQETVSRWESGSAAIGLAELGAYAKVLQAPMGWFLGEETERPAPYVPKQDEPRKPTPADPRAKGKRVTRKRGEERQG